MFILCVASLFAEDSLAKRENTDAIKREIKPLDGSVYCGYEYDGTSDYWSMAIKSNEKNRELFEVAWTKPLSTLAPPYDYKYRNAEKLVLTGNDGKKVSFLRSDQNSRYEAEIDSEGNLINGIIFDMEKQKYYKSNWRLLKVK